MESIDNKIIDIRISNNKIFLLKEFELTTDTIKELIKDYNYSGMGLLKDTEVESAMLPPFILSFYNFVFIKELIPTQEQFFNYYIKRYYTILPNNKCIIKETLKNKYTYKPISLEGIRARLLRTYPSLIRDIHFYLMCQESGLFDKVSYSLNQDYYDGNDILIELDNKKYTVSLFVETSRSLYYKHKKNSRHKYDETELIVRINKAECEKVGPFFLCRNYHVKYILKEIEKLNKESELIINI